MRYEVNRWHKDQGCHFQSFDAKGGLMLSETERTDNEKHRLWSFALVDTSLYETRSDLIPLPDKMTLFASTALLPSSSLTRATKKPPTRWISL